MPVSALRQGTHCNLSLPTARAALGVQGIAMGRLAVVLEYLLQGRPTFPYRQRVLSNATYRFIGDQSHPEMPGRIKGCELFGRSDGPPKVTAER